VACKQRAYRQRVTDDVRVPRDGHKKRNAKTVTDNVRSPHDTHKKRNAKAAHVTRSKGPQWIALLSRSSLRSFRS
jgi:hypothetical protein